APAARAPSPTGVGPAPLRVTMEELHRHGGVPRGWRFSVPPGDPARGRQVFADLECYKCHAIDGESFPPAGGDAKNVGPELTGMGGQHPKEYFAESVLAPNRVILLGPGFTGPDGLSIMPSFADSISLAQWVDLAAYLSTLTAGGHDHRRSETEHELVTGDYRLRLVYVPPAGGHGHGAPAGGHEHGAPSKGAQPGAASSGGSHQHGASPGGGHQHGAPPKGAQPGAAPSGGHHHGADHDAHHRAHHGGAGHLMAFVLDRETDEPVPYLPVTVTVHAASAAPRSVKLAPMIGDRGFHYGADLTLPERTERIAVGIGPTTMRVTGSAGSRFRKPVTAVIDWAGK
ncbi:MAG: c-type cytochrome, partial [Candidatus Rokuibacteriota bacterium]